MNKYTEKQIPAWTDPKFYSDPNNFRELMTVSEYERMTFIGKWVYDHGVIYIVSYAFAFVWVGGLAIGIVLMILNFIVHH